MTDRDQTRCICGEMVVMRIDHARQRLIFQHGPNPEAVWIVPAQQLIERSGFGADGDAWLAAIHAYEDKR